MGPAVAPGRLTAVDRITPIAAHSASHPGASITRLDIRLESEGAEFLELGQLLLARIRAYKTYTNMPGYDLVATNPERNLSGKIQVKGRWRTGAPGFPIRNFGCDFVVFCRLNRGNKAGTGKVSAPEYFVMPVHVVQASWQDDAWGKVFLRDIDDVGQYRDRWDVIQAFLHPAPEPANQHSW